MKKKLFVGNLSWKVTEENLKPLFAAFGTIVSIKVVMDPFTGRSKGFAFVEMESEDSAAKAMAELNDRPCLDRNMRISLAREQQRDNRRPSTSGAGPRGGYSRQHHDHDEE